MQEENWTSGARDIDMGSNILHKTTFENFKQLEFWKALKIQLCRVSDTED